MKSRQVLNLTVAMAVLVAVTGLRATPGASQDAEPPFDVTTSKDPDAVTFRKVCVDCHPIDRIVSARHTAFEWQETVEKMLVEGAKGTDEDLQTVFRFLVKRFGKVNVNVASAEEIAAVLSLSDAQGGAIVQYRTDHGKFTDLASVRKVPGLEMARLNPDAIRFQ